MTNQAQAATSVDNVQPIAFPKEYKKLDDNALKALKGDIAKLKGAENLSVKLINELTPALIEHVLGGGNVSVVTEMMLALHGSRRTPWLIFMRKHFGHEYDKDANRFGKRKSAGQFTKCCEAYEEFKASGHTVMQWIALNTRTEPKEFDAVKRTDSYVKAMFKHGIDAKDLVNLLTAAIESNSDKAPKAEEAA